MVTRNSQLEEKSRRRSLEPLQRGAEWNKDQIRGRVWKGQLSRHGSAGGRILRPDRGHSSANQRKVKALLNVLGRFRAGSFTGLFHRLDLVLETRR